MTSAPRSARTITPRSLAAALLAAAAAPAAAQPGAGDEPLRALFSCEVGGAQACMDVEGHNFCDFVRRAPGAADRPCGIELLVRGMLDPELQPPDAPRFEGRLVVQEGVMAASLRGRLDGAPAREHDVRLQVADTPCGAVARLAYLGRAEDGAPVILTDAGELAIEEPRLELVNDPARTLVDARTERVVAVYAAPWNWGTFFFHSSTEVYVRHRDLCMTAPSAGPGRIALAPGACVEDAGAPPYAVNHGLSPRLEGDAEVVARAAPEAVGQWGEQFPEAVYRVRGTDVVVYDWTLWCT